MKNNVAPDLLAKCLTDIECGRSTIEDCIAAYPAVAEELCSLLEIAQAVGPLPPVAPDPAFRVRGRAALVAAMAAEKDPVTNWTLRRLFRQMTAGWKRPPQMLAGRMGMPALIVALIVALTTVGGGGAVYASQDALPGDALYQIKATVESLQLGFAADDEARAQAYIDLASKRIAEAQKAIDQGNPAAAAEAAEAAARNIAQADQHLVQGSKLDRDVSKAAKQLVEALDRQQTLLARAEERAPEQAQKALVKAERMAEKALEHASARLDKATSRTAAADASTTPTPTVSPTITTTAVPTGVAVTVPLTTTVAVSNTVGITLTQMISDVNNLSADPNVKGHSYEGLLAKLRAAENAIDRGQTNVAANILNAFLGELNAFRGAGHISTENYEALQTSYSALVSGLGEKTGGQAAPGRSGPHSGQPDLTPEPTETSESDHARGASATPQKGKVGAEDEHGRENGRAKGATTPVPTGVAPAQSPAAAPHTEPGSPKGNGNDKGRGGPAR